MKYTKIPLDTFQNMELNAGILLYDFDPENPPSDEELYKNLIGATSGGISVSAVPSFSDLGEDIDNCPKNTKELKKLESWETTMSGTFVTMSKDSTKFQLAAADIDGDKIILRNDLDNDSDFRSIWWVGDYNQGKGFVACHMLNALSTGGLSIGTNDQGKATADFEITGHYSIDAQDTVPLECYIYSGEEPEG